MSVPVIRSCVDRVITSEDKQKAEAARSAARQEELRKARQVYDEIKAAEATRRQEERTRWLAEQHAAQEAERAAAAATAAAAQLEKQEKEDDGDGNDDDDNDKKRPRRFSVMFAIDDIDEPDQDEGDAQTTRFAEELQNELEAEALAAATQAAGEDDDDDDDTFLKNLQDDIQEAKFLMENTPAESNAEAGEIAGEDVEGDNDEEGYGSGHSEAGIDAEGVVSVDAGEDLASFEDGALFRRDIRSRCWPVGSTVRVYFMDGNVDLQSAVLDAANEWTVYANIVFAETVSARDAHIRVSFQSNYSWSYVGTDAQHVLPSEPTMSLGSLGVRPLSSLSRTSIRRETLHQFGHALGMGHEHCAENGEGDNVIPWNTDRATHHFCSAFGLTPAEVRLQVMSTYAANQSHRITGAPDNASVMTFPIDERLLLEGSRHQSRGHMSMLSEGDKQLAAFLYPFPDGGRPCSFGVLQRRLLQQRIVTCNTCEVDVCGACAEQCHNDHQLQVEDEDSEESKSSVPLSMCDCGSGRSPNPCICPPPPAVQLASWRCSKCFLRNDKDSTDCEVCMSPIPLIGSPDEAGDSDSDEVWNEIIAGTRVTAAGIPGCPRAVRLSWAGPSEPINPPSRFDVRLRLVPAQHTFCVPDVAVRLVDGQCVCDLDGLSPGTSYEIHVRAGYGDWSATALYRVPGREMVIFIGNATSRASTKQVRDNEEVTCFKWCFFVRGSKEVVRTIDRVELSLPEDRFRVPTVVLSEAPFRKWFDGWSSIPVDVTVHFKDLRPPLTHIWVAQLDPEKGMAEDRIVLR